MNPLIQLKTTAPLLITLAVLCFALLPTAQAVNPPPDGSYFGANTAEGGAALLSLTTGSNNTALGAGALQSLTTGIQNTATGAQSLKNNTGDKNTADGFQTLVHNTTGTENTATGWRALFQNTTGDFSTAVGVQALYHNTTGGANTAVGVLALVENTIGVGNTAVGVNALQGNSTGNENTAVGAGALFFNIGNHNTAIGNVALWANSADDNTANGFGALYNNNGAENTAIGGLALSNNTTGSANTADGYNALLNNITGNNNVALGVDAGNAITAADNVICVGSLGADVSNTTWIGNIYGVTTQSDTTAPVVVSNQGQLGTIVSSERFKKDITTMEKASEAILSLRPVTFHYKTDTKGMSQFGLIAEEVAKVNPALVLPDKEGKPYSVRYEAVNAMLLNEFLKEHRKVEQQETTIAQLKQDFQSKLAQQQKQIEALTAGLQKVSAELELNNPAPQTVENND